MSLLLKNFSELQGVELLVQELSELSNARLTSSLPIELTMKTKIFCKESFFNTLEEEQKTVVLANEQLFLTWINENVITAIANRKKYIYEESRETKPKKKTFELDMEKLVQDGNESKGGICSVHERGTEIELLVVEDRKTSVEEMHDVPNFSEEKVNEEFHLLRDQVCDDVVEEGLGVSQNEESRIIICNSGSESGVCNVSFDNVSVQTKLSTEAIREAIAGNEECEGNFTNSAVSSGKRFLQSASTDDRGEDVTKKHKLSSQVTSETAVVVKCVAEHVPKEGGKVEGMIEVEDELATSNGIEDRAVVGLVEPDVVTQLPEEGETGDGKMQVESQLRYAKGTKQKVGVRSGEQDHVDAVTDRSEMDIDRGSVVDHTPLEEKKQSMDEIGSTLRWIKDGSLKLNRFQYQRLHAGWYRENIMTPVHDVTLKLGYTEVEYPNVLRIARPKHIKHSVGDAKKKCAICSCLFVAGDRTVSVDGETKDGQRCPHKYCDRCAYGWFLRLPKKADYLKKYMVVTSRKLCGHCKVVGKVRQSVYKVDDEHVTPNNDCIEDALFPNNMTVFGFHQVPMLSKCNYITEEHLMSLIQKLEVLKEDGTVCVRDTEVLGISALEKRQYDLYHAAVYERFKCSRCGMEKSCVEEFVIETCVPFCKYTLCLDCSSEAVVERFGSRKGQSDTKYLEGYTVCKVCSCKEGRLLNKLTDMYYSKKAMLNTNVLQL